MADVTVSYKGSIIAELSDTGDKTLLTQGKYCEDDILIDYVKSGGGTPKINGAVYDCGEFTLATNTDSNYTVSHSLGVVPSAVFLWVVNPSYETRGIIGKYATDVSSVLNASITAVNGALATGTGSSAARMRTYKTADDITFCCDSTYPLVAGLRYQWLAIGTEVTV